MQNRPAPQANFRAFRVELADHRSYWTVVDDDYELSALADQFLFDLRFGRDRAESTTRVYAGDLARFLSWCASSGLGLEEAASHLGRFVLSLRTTAIERAGASAGRPPGPARVNHVLTVVRELYKHAAGNASLPASVLAALYEVADDRFFPAELRRDGGGLAYRARPRHRLRTPRRAEVDAATQAEWEALLQAAGSWRDRFLLVLLWFSGLRIGEALGLRREDLHFVNRSGGVGCSIDGPHLHVVRREVNSNGALAKSRDERTVPVGTYVLSYYDRYVEERLACPVADACDFVFVNLFHRPLGTPMTASAVRQALRGLSRRADLARVVHPHMFRHATGSGLSEAGVPIDVIQALLGHRSIISTGVYVHPSGAAKRAAVEAVGELARARQASRRGDARGASDAR